MISKTQFIKIIKAIKDQNEYDLQVANNLSKAFPNAYEANLLPDNHFIANALLELLQVTFDDNHPDSWIEYFLWELNFGKKYRDGCVLNKDGSIINLSNAEYLYDYLSKNKK